MGRYEKTITKTSHINRMIVAILIFFVIGLGFGYLCGQKINKKLEPITNVQKVNAKIEPVKTAKDIIPDKNEQITLIKDALKSFYDINLNTYKTLENESLQESKTQGVSQDSLFKDKLIIKYQGLLANSQLQIVTDFISKGDIKSEYFLDYFYSQEGSTISSVDNVEYNANSISAKAVVVHPFQYGNIYDIPTADSFLNDFKGIGMTKQQYTKLLKYKPSIVNMIETKKVTVKIEKIKEKWMITSMNDEMVSSEISDVIIKKKSITVAELMKKYIK